MSEKAPNLRPLSPCVGEGETWSVGSPPLRAGDSPWPGVGELFLCSQDDIAILDAYESVRSKPSW